MCILKCGKDINSYDRTVGYNDMVQGINNSKL